MISRAESGWRPVISSVPEESVLGLVLYNTFINDQDEGIKSTLSKFDVDTKLGEVAETPEDWAAIW